MGADVGDGAFEGEAAENFVGQKAEIGMLVRGEGGAQKDLRFIRPSGGMIASGGREREPASRCQPAGPQVVEMGPADSEPDTCVARGQLPVVEGGEGCFDNFRGQAVEQLFVFTRASKSGPPPIRQRLMGLCPKPRSLSNQANGSGESVPSPERGRFQ
jgi:hypothetical protein